MTRYVALLDGGRREEPVEVEAVAPGVYQVTVGGVTRRFDAFAHDAGTLSLLVEGESHSAELDERRGGTRVAVRGSVFNVEILDERRLRARRAARK